MPEGIRLIVFDADDTLWESEPFFRGAEAEVAGVLSHLGEPEFISGELYKTEIRNMSLYGYGAKAYILSMIETAVRLSGGSLSAGQVMAIIDSGRKILDNPATPMPGVEACLKQLRASGKYRMALLTKGDILDQERKLERSGLGPYFHNISIVSEKTGSSFAGLCKAEGVSPAELLSVGNSFKSDVAPVLQLGGYGVHVPFRILWKLEHSEEYDHPRLYRLGCISELPALLEGT